MSIVSVITTAIISYVAGEIGSSVGQATYSAIKCVADYVWLDPEHGYFLDYPEDPEKTTTLRTIKKRLAAMKSSEDKPWRKEREEAA